MVKQDSTPWARHAWLPLLLLSAAPSAPAADGPRAGQGALVAKGYVIPVKQVTVSSDVPGRVIELRVEEGQVVKRGDVVARLDPAHCQADLDHAQARLRLARAVAEKAATGGAGEAAVAQAEVAVAQAAGRRAQARLEATVIRAPV